VFLTWLILQKIELEFTHTGLLLAPTVSIPSIFSKFNLHPFSLQPPGVAAWIRAANLSRFGGCNSCSGSKSFGMVSGIMFRLA
jgi:hypothetical protein